MFTVLSAEADPERCNDGGEAGPAPLAVAQDVVNRAMSELRQGRWVGIGLAVDGEAAERLARSAMDRAQRAGNRVPIAVVGQVPTRQVEAAEAVLRLVGKLVMERSESEWRVVDRLTPGLRGEQRAVAAELGITVQAVSGAVRRSDWQEELAGRAAAALLLEQAEQTIAQWR